MSESSTLNGMVVDRGSEVVGCARLNSVLTFWRSLTRIEVDLTVETFSTELDWLRSNTTRLAGVGRVAEVGPRYSPKACAPREAGTDMRAGAGGNPASPEVPTAAGARGPTIWRMSGVVGSALTGKGVKRRKQQRDNDLLTLIWIVTVSLVHFNIGVPTTRVITVIGSR